MTPVAENSNVPAPGKLGYYDVHDVERPLPTVVAWTSPISGSPANATAQVRVTARDLPG